jgi:gas vesicle protein
MSEDNNTRVAGALMLIAGGIVGAGLALLFAPQSGKATRKDIARYARKTKRRAEDVVEEFSSCVSKMVESAGETAEDILDKGKDMAEEAKKDILRAFDKGQEKFEKQRAKIARLIS